MNLRTISLTVSKTINLGKYNSIRVEAGLTADRTDDDPPLEVCVAELNVRIQRILADLYREQIAAEPRQ